MTAQPPTATPAYWIDGQPAAPAAFYRAACDPRRSAVVEACAGAGKTWMLVSRTVRALLDGAEPQQILAITFTRKAAGEMRERLQQWLHGFARASEAERAEALVQRGCSAAEADALAPALGALEDRLLAGGRPVEIRTFHGWFSQLLRAAPLVLRERLGLPGEIELIEDRTDLQPVYWRRFLRTVGADADLRADFTALVHAHGRYTTAAWLEAALDQRTEIERADAAGTLASSVPAAAALWPAFAGLPTPAAAVRGPVLQALLRDLARQFGSSGKAKQVHAAARIEAALALADDAACFHAVRKALFTDNGTPRKLGDRPAQAEACDALERIGPAVAQQTAHVTHGRLVRLARVLLASWRQLKQARGLADMADLDSAAEQLLADAELAGWIHERLDQQLRHLLIDEFQDTSPLQWRAIGAWLAGYAGAGGGASGQRGLSVFLVGDPKQSIYRFRRADPRVFSEAGDFVVQALGGRRLACDHTRRNAPAVLAVLNAVFGAAQAEQAFDGFRPHTTSVQLPTGAVELLPVRRRVEAASDGPRPAWRDSLTTPRTEPDEALRMAEARLVAQQVADCIAQRGHAPGDIHVLSRKRAPLVHVAEALRERGIPHATPEQRDMLSAPEVRDLVALLDVLASPAHDLSLAHALRSPLFGAADDDLVAIASAARAARCSWWQALLGGAGAGRPAPDRARRLLPGWAAAAAALPPHDVLDRIVAEGDVQARYAGCVPPPARAAALAAIDALLAQALRLGGGRHATPYNLVRRLRRERVLLPPLDAADAVQLMTVHGAKGLEARTVFVVDAMPEPPKAGTAGLLIDWPAGAAHPRRCAFVASEARCPPSLAGLMADEHAGRRREELNGLYVAMTRARERLVLSATEPSRGSSEPSAWQRLREAGAVELPAEASRRVNGMAAADAPATVRVLPQVGPWPAMPPRLPARPTADGAAGDAGPAMPPRSPVRPAGGPAGEAPVGPRAAPRTVGTSSSPAAGGPAADSVVDSAATRLGRAVHRVLEWLPAADDAAALQAAGAAAAAEFGLPAAAGDDAAALAARVLRSPACRRFFDDPALHWAGNEVPIVWRGAALRIDRLVAFDTPAGRVWWVLDYKLQHAPQTVDAYRAQLASYRDAVQALQPGDAVQAAFITGAGEVVAL